MIRISEIRLPLTAAEQPDAPLRAAAAGILALPLAAIASVHLHKRSFDARKAELLAVYIVDVTLADPTQEAPLLARLAGKPHVQATPDMVWQPPARAPADLPLRPVVVGFGPCGIFAALCLAQMGFRPIVLERGKPVRERTQDTWGLWRKHVLNPESNVQFGEGGAGTFSDGKLYSQIKDPRHLGRKVMDEFVKAGAPPEILFEAHPHIGTFKLVKVVEHLRAQIIALGGEIRFQQRVVDVEIEAASPPGRSQARPAPEGLRAAAPGLPAQGRTARRDADSGSVSYSEPHAVSERGGQPASPPGRSQGDGSPPGGQRTTRSGERGGKHLRGLTVLDMATGQTYELRADHVVMALGHSARDTFAMLYARGVAMQSKPFSIGFRVEHPQGLIDRARWGRHAGHPLLGAADYKLVHHATDGLGKGRSVYSFCMCPGGTVVAATSEVGRVVTNGMSQYSRNERNANAGIVVGIEPPDYPHDPAAFEATLGQTYGVEALTPGAPHPLAGIVLQRQLESGAYVLGGSNYEAPGQLVGDFLVGKPSTQLGEVAPSYQPGVLLGDLHAALPGYAIAAMREAFPAFGRKIKGFDRHDAVLTGVETRTSSPLRIPRGDDLQSLNVRGLYPAGEGAGYAGGILSAGVDGIKVAEALAQQIVATAGPAQTR